MSLNKELILKYLECHDQYITLKSDCGKCHINKSSISSIIEDECVHHDSMFYINMENGDQFIVFATDVLSRQLICSLVH